MRRGPHIALLFALLLCGCMYFRGGRPVQKQECSYTIPRFAQELPNSLVEHRDPPPKEAEGEDEQRLFASVESRTEAVRAEREGWGYKVQIYLTLSEEDAESVASAARARLEEKVVVEFDPPYYKVRIGNCTSADEAEELLYRVKSAGYPDAWIVRSRVVGD